MKMEKFFVLVCLYFLLAFNATARERIVFELGSASGEYTYRTDDPKSNKKYEKIYDHDLAGSIWNIAYVHSLNSGILLGIGYQSFTMKGASRKIAFGQPITHISQRFNNLSGSGPFGLLGYDFYVTKSLSFIPQFRLGFLNTLTVNRVEEETKIQSGKKYYTDMKYEYHFTEVQTQGLTLPLLFESGGVIFGIAYQFFSAKAEIDQDSRGYRDKTSEDTKPFKDIIKTDHTLQLTLGHWF